MPIAGSSSPPTRLPPAGTRWVLQRNVVIYDGVGQAPLNLPGLANQQATYGYGTNYGHPDQSDPDGYSMSNLYAATIDVYLDDTLTETMSPDWAPSGQSPNNPATAAYVKVDGGDIIHFVNPSVGSGEDWPRIFEITYTATQDAPAGVTVGMWLMSIRGDVWVALPASSKLSALNPTSGSLDPEKAGLEVTWVQKNTRVPVILPKIGSVGALTWPRPGWTAKKFLVDGYRLSAEASENSGGWTAELDTYFVRIPGDPATVLTPPSSESGVPHVARTDVDVTDDPYALTL